MRAELVFDNLVAYRSQALFAPVKATVGAGTLVAVVGPNGVGKTSLLTAVIGRGIRRSGRVLFNGEDLGRLPTRELAQTVSFVGQDAFASNELHVHDVVEVGARAGGRGSHGHLVGESLERLGITHLAHRRYSRLSGGERQLVQVARLLAQNSPVMLLDEPVSALDLRHQLRVMQVLGELTRAGHIVIVTMHDLTQARRWADEVALMIPGQVVFGSPHLILTPHHIRSVYGVSAETFLSPSGTPVINPLRVACPTALDLSPTPISQ